MYDVIIIGAGPAGMAAAIYTTNKNVKTLVVTKEFYNMEIKEGLLTAEDLKLKFEQVLQEKPTVLEFKNNLEVINLEKNVVSFSVEVNSGQLYYSRCVIITTGKNMQSGEGNSGFDLITYKDQNGKVKVDSNMSTNVPGLFAAGNVIQSFSRNDLFISSGQGAKAAVSVMDFLNK